MRLPRTRENADFGVAVPDPAVHTQLAPPAHLALHPSREHKALGCPGQVHPPSERAEPAPPREPTPQSGPIPPAT